MATVLNDAVVRIILDPSAAKAELDALEKGAGQIGDAEKKAEESAKKGEEAAKKAGGGPGTERGGGAGGKFRLPPLTAAGFAGALPFVGGAARFATEQLQRFGPMAEGITKGMASELPPGLREIVETAIGKTIGEVRQIVDAVDAKLKAVSATFDQMKSVGKAALMIGGRIDADDIAAFARNEYAIQSTLLRFQREKEAQVLKEMGSSGAGQVLNALRRGVKVN
jgi:hypothetical protein